MRRTSSFGENIRKFSLINAGAHGLIEARGVDLEIVTADPTVCEMLRWSGEASVCARLPTSVHDLLPPDARPLHRRLLSRAVADGALPAALRRALVGASVQRLDGSTVRVDVFIGLVDPSRPIDPDTTLFYAVLTEHHPPAAAITASA